MESAKRHTVCGFLATHNVGLVSQGICSASIEWLRFAECIAVAVKRNLLLPRNLGYT
jgi:hypothetical protein